MQQFAGEYDVKIVGVNMLVLNLGNKSEYVVHYKNLPLHSSLRMKLTKNHRISKSKQSDWLRKYIDFNTNKRKNAATSFEKIIKLKDFTVSFTKQFIGK